MTAGGESTCNGHTQLTQGIGLYKRIVACVVGMMKMGNIVSRAGIEPISLASGPVCYHYTM